MGTNNNNMEMSFRIRSSKFRHVYGNPTRKDHCYEGIRISKHAHDSNQCAVNPKFLSVCTESAGGGSFIVLPLDRIGRVDVNSPKVCGHSGPVLDLKWNPFNDHVIASCSEDATVKVWQIPNDGLHVNVTDWLVDLHGHQRRVGYIEWHPTAENIVLSAGLDYKCIIWNVEQAEPVNIISCHSETIFSISWNRDGSLFSTTSKDRKLRVIDPRAGCVAVEGEGHNSPKVSKVIMLGNTCNNNYLYTTGFSRSSDRQHALWDIRNLRSSLNMETVDFSNGVLTPFYDHDTSVMFVAGKGDGNIRYYELVSEAPYCHYLDQYTSSVPQRSVCAMPKRGCDAHRNEIMRFYKLYADKLIIEPISMIVPRRSETFQDDIFPATSSSMPSLTSDEWITGLNRDPILISLQDGSLTNSPKTTASSAVQRQEVSLLNAPTITTYKAVQKKHPVNGVHLPDAKVAKKSATVSPYEASTVTVTASLAPSQKRHVPASIKNIQRLSSQDSFSDPMLTESSSPDVNNMIASFESKRTKSSSSDTGDYDITNSYSKRFWASSHHPTTNGTMASDTEHTDQSSVSSLSPLSHVTMAMDVDTHTDYTTHYNRNNNNTRLTKSASLSDHVNSTTTTLSSDYLSRTPSYKRLIVSQSSVDFSGDTSANISKIHVKKVWSPPQSVSPPHWDFDTLPKSDPELKKAYFRQVEEIRSLKEQVVLKDKRIRQLEEELVLVRDMSCDPAESNC